MNKLCFSLQTLEKQFSSTVTFSRRLFTFEITGEPRLQVEADAPQCGWILARETVKVANYIKIMPIVPRAIQLTLVNFLRSEQQMLITGA